MSKLKAIIKGYVREELGARGYPTLVPAVVTKVREDYLRADVQLIEGGAKLKDMLNKTGEKLYVGQYVTIEYLTLPSAGWIEKTGDEADPLNEGGGGGLIERAAVLTEDAAGLLVGRELVPLNVGQRSQAYYGSMKNKFYINNGLTVIFAANAAELLAVVTEDDLAMFNVGIQNQAGVVKNYDLLLYSITKNSNSSEFLTYIPSIYTQDRLGWRNYSSLVTTANSAKGPRTMGLVYRATSIQGPAAAYPYGRVAGQLHVVSFDLNGNVYSTSTLATAQGSGSDIYPNYQNFRSQAEYDFALSMVTRSELTDGG